MLRRAFPEAPPNSVADADGVCRMRLPKANPPDQGPGHAPSRAADDSSTVTILAADWTHGHRLAERGTVTLESADAVLLLPSHHQPIDGVDIDGRIALDGLHLAHLERTGGVRFQPGTHILALVRDPTKGDLLESRLVAMAGETRACRYTVISRERARHRFIMQNVFVHGLSLVYLELLSSRGQHFARLRARDSNGQPLQGKLDTGRLAEELLVHRGWLLIGFELLVEKEGKTGSQIEVRIDPEVLRDGTILPWSTVNALYLMLDSQTKTSPAEQAQTPDTYPNP